jgi:xyloglucan-specific exo-beta-1,4-glucanase
MQRPSWRQVAALCLAVIIGVGGRDLWAQGRVVRGSPDVAPVARSGDRPQREPYVWQDVKVGGGGFIPGIVFSPVEKGLVYLRSDMGGAYRWDDARQSWLPLHDQLGESSYFGTESIAPDPRDANVVYVAAGMYSLEPSAIMRSRDRGEAWDIFPVEFAMGGNENGRGMGERLAVDPNMTSVLYFGSRYNGLQVSTDYGPTWRRVESFPIKGQGRPQKREFGWTTKSTGLSFVVFDPASRAGSKGQGAGSTEQGASQLAASLATRVGPTQVIYVGATEPDAAHLFRSTDAGRTWEAVPGQPGSDMLPSHAALDAQGVLYISYGNGIGPNGLTDGAVWKLDTKTGEWTDITPDKSPNRSPGGYGGLAIDRQRPNTIAVATLNRWNPGDTVWRSTDGGQTWADIRDKSERDVSETPFLYWGRDEAELGWWMAALAIDPFDSDHACYATGATIYATHEFSKVNEGQVTHWRPWVRGIEQTAVIALMSPATGPHLISAFGDISGFTHEDFDVSQPIHTNPTFGNTNLLDYAGRNPSVVVRAGTAYKNGPTMAYSEDAGRTWQPLADPPQPAEEAVAAGLPTEPPVRGQETSAQQLARFRRDRAGVGLTVSANGRTIIATPRVAMLTEDRGKTWQRVKGLPEGVRPVADRVNAQKFYALDFATGNLYVSTDGGQSFKVLRSEGLPDTAPDTPWDREAMWPLQATLEQEGDLWYVGEAGLFHSTDGGSTFRQIEIAPRMNGLSFGKAPPGKDYPAMFCIGTLHGVKAVWRSDDVGARWIRINDDEHQWGTRFRCIAADPRIFGRVYVGTDGRGIVYGTPAVAADRSTP